MQIICFEDQHVARLNPITLARPAYAITCASLKLIDWLRLLSEETSSSLSVSVRPYLQTIQQLDEGLLPPTRSESSDILLVNARLAPKVGTLEALKKIAASTKSTTLVDTDDSAVVAAKIQASDLAKPDSAGAMTWIDHLLEIASGVQQSTESDLTLFRWPHEVIATHMSQMPAAMEWRLKTGDYQQTQDGVFVREGVQIGDYASVDTSDGPILLDKNVQVGPFSMLAGPVYAGAGTRVIEHSALKDGVALGHTVKIGGEVEASVIEPFTNKQHHGFLGHSYLGSWINLGAGTCNSDLKNTYGKINMQYGDAKITTGMQFLGCVMGDYSKTAINTSIFTGKVIGVCSMLYGFATSNVPSFVNYARLFGQTAPLPAEVMISTQARMFARRKVQQRDCDKQLILDMYEQTADERESSEQYGL